jgi:hypothetical protein
MRWNWFERVLRTDPGKIAQSVTSFKPVGYEDVVRKGELGKNSLVMKRAIRSTLKKKKIK